MSSDTWSDIQEYKTKQSSLRDKMLRRRKANEGLVADITGATNKSPAAGESCTDYKSEGTNSSLQVSTDIKQTGSSSPRMEGDEIAGEYFIDFELSMETH